MTQFPAEGQTTPWRDQLKAYIDERPIDLVRNSLLQGVTVANESIWPEGAASNGQWPSSNTAKRYTALADASELRLGYVNARGREDFNATAAIQIRASAVLSDGSMIPVFFAGKRDVVIEPRGVVFSDPLTCEVKKDEMFHVRTYLAAAPGQHRVAISGAPTGGTFTLTVDGVVTEAIAYNQTITDLANRVNKILPAGMFVSVGGAVGNYLLRFSGAKVPTTIEATSSLTGGTAPAITITKANVFPQQGGTPNTQSSLVSAWGEGSDAVNGTTQPDKTTMSNATGFLGGVAGYYPSFIVGTPREPITRLVGLTGDSISSGLGDTAFDTERGFARRGLKGVSYIGTTASGESMAEGYALRLQLLRGATSHLCALGVNQMVQNKTLAQLQASAIPRWLALARFGSPVYQTTITPSQNTSTDGWATVGNQTVANNNTTRAEFNDWLRDGAPILAGAAVATGSNATGTLRAGQAGHPLAGYFETADAVETARNSGRWKVGFTADGLHPSTAGHIAMRDAINWDLLV